MMRMTEDKQRNSIWRVLFRYSDKPKSKSRPFIVLIKVEGRVQGFRMTSRNWHDGVIRYYRVKNLEGTGLTEDTWIDLESVFPPEEDFLEYMGELNPEDRFGMQRQLRQYLEFKDE